MYEWYEWLGWSEDDEREYQERERYWHECENWNATQAHLRQAAASRTLTQLTAMAAHRAIARRFGR